MKVHYLAVQTYRNTEVLGYPCDSRYGWGLFQMLDWDSWWIDYTDEGHIFSSPRCAYFHVPVREKNGDKDGRVFRVRCRYAGSKYKGRQVESVSIGCKDGRLHWIVRTVTRIP